VDAQGETRVRSHHKRVLVAKNIGNLALHVKSFSIENQGCSAFGFTIENCSNFHVAAGETFYI